MPKCPCSSDVYIQRVTVEENAAKAIFKNPDKKKFTKTQVDGCLMKNETACDWFITREDCDGVLVELKGSDVAHALDQIKASFAYLRDQNRLTLRRAGLVVCVKRPQHPAFNSKVQRVKEHLRKNYSAPLHIIVGNKELEFDRLLEHAAYRP